MVLVARLMLAVQAGIEAFVPKQYLSALHSENGPHEMAQFLLMVLGLGVAVTTLWQKRHVMLRWMKAWFGMAALCCLYVAGEEISWGQHILEWATPAFWTEYNDQQETNLHNVSSWLDQKPRLLLLIGVVVGGIVIPALKKWKAGLVPARFDMIYPSGQFTFLAVLILGLNIVVKIAESFGVALFERHSEFEELLLFYFVVLYLVLIRRRVA